MSQSQVDSAVADASGESLQTIHALGFSNMPDDPGDSDPEGLALVLDCPFCGHRVPYPGLSGDGSPALAECLGCDVYFDFAPDEVYASGTIARPRVDVA